MNGSKRVGALAGVTVAAIAASVLLAFATIDPPPLPVKHKKTPVIASAAATPAPMVTASAPPALAPIAPTVPKAADPAPQPRPSAVPSGQPGGWTAMPIDDLRSRANANEIPAMEELGRRLLQGVDVAKDPQAGTGWLLRAAGLGSAQSAFNIGVMYERGFVVERDSSKAAEWYRKAADAGLPAAKHNLALLLRDGKGTPRDVKAATALLLSAARQGMAASMFTLGDIYEQGDGGTKDPSAALAWFAITGEFERQTNRDGESALAKTASQRAQVLKRTLTTAELEHAQEMAQSEFKQIVAALTPAPQPQPSSTVSGATPPPPAAPPPADSVALDWPKKTADQVRAVQQGLFDLKRLRDKPDGTLGPKTRAAIRDFQKRAGLRETGDPSREVYVALMSVRHDIVTDSPLPTPPQVAATREPGTAEPAKVEPAKPGPAPATALTPTPSASLPPTEAKIDLAAPELAPPPTSADIAAAGPVQQSPKIDPPKVDPPKPSPVVVDTTKPQSPRVDAIPPSLSPADIPLSTPPPPPTSADIARTTPPPAPVKLESRNAGPAKVDPDAWPAGRVDQVKAIQTLLRDLRFYSRAVDGQSNAATTGAIREYQRMVGAKENGEPNKVLFESLKEMRKLMAPASAAKPAGAAAN